jgi:hypothetical protein
MRCTSRLLVLLILSALPASAAAQSRDKYWGIAGTVAPWRAGDEFKGLYDAQGLDMSGNDLRVGVTRGSTLGSEWAILYLRRRIAEGGTIVGRHETYEFRQDVRLTGVMAEAYGAFVTIADRAQIGGVAAAGLARAEGMVRRVSGAPDVEARKALTLFASEVRAQLLLRAELAAAFKLAPGAKVRVSGGFAWPGTTVVTVTAMYFFGER